MRTVTAEQRELLRAEHLNIYGKVEVKNEDDAWIDLTDLESQDFFDDATVDDDIDAPVMSSTIHLVREADGHSLAPMMESSQLNRLVDGITYSPLLDVGRQIRVSTAVTANQVAPVSGDWRYIFEGYLDEVDWKTDVVELKARDLGARILDTFIEEKRTYGLTAGEAVETAMQRILDDNMGVGVIDLYTPVSPGWNILPYSQDFVGTLDAIRTLAQQIGWDVRYRYDSAGDFRLTFFNPPRELTAPVDSFAPDEYFDVKEMNLKLDDIRNVVKVSFKPAEPMINEQFVAPFVIREQAASIAAYGRRWMEIHEADSSNIDTTVEAEAMADAAVRDLAFAPVAQEIETMFFWPIQLGDYYEFYPNLVHYDSFQKWAVVGYKHQLKDGDGTTTMKVRGKPAGAYREWLRKGISGGNPVEPPMDLPWATIEEIDRTPTQIQYHFNGGPSRQAGESSEVKYRITVAKFGSTTTTEWATLPPGGVDMWVTPDPVHNTVVIIYIWDIAQNFGHASVHLTGMAIPIVVREQVFQTATIGTLLLDIQDPQARVTGVWFAEAIGNNPLGAYVQDTTLPYGHDITLVDKQPSRIAYKIFGLNANDVSAVLAENVVPFPAQKIPVTVAVTNTAATTTNIRDDFTYGVNTSYVDVFYKEYSTDPGSVASVEFVGTRPVAMPLRKGDGRTSINYSVGTPAYWIVRTYIPYDALNVRGTVLTIKSQAEASTPPTQPPDLADLDLVASSETETSAQLDVTMPAVITHVDLIRIYTTGDILLGEFTRTASGSGVQTVTLVGLEISTTYTVVAKGVKISSGLESENPTVEATFTTDTPPPGSLNPPTGGLLVVDGSVATASWTAGEDNPPGVDFAVYIKIADESGPDPEFEDADFYDNTSGEVMLIDFDGVDRLHVWVVATLGGYEDSSSLYLGSVGEVP